MKQKQGHYNDEAEVAAGRICPRLFLNLNVFLKQRG
jgi:hypothetical protein